MNDNEYITLDRATKIYRLFRDNVEKNKKAIAQLELDLEEHLTDQALSDKLTELKISLTLMEEELTLTASKGEVETLATVFQAKLDRINSDIETLKAAPHTCESANQELMDKIQQNSQSVTANADEISQLKQRATEADKGLQFKQQTIAQQLKAFNRAFVGQVSAFACAKAPAGWLVADGAPVQRGDYPELWAFAQTSGNLAASDSEKTAGQFGPGDGETSFTLPDLRGEFIRGVDAKRELGSVQQDAVKAHTHAGNIAEAGAHTHTASSDYQGAHRHSGETANAGNHSHSGSTSAGGSHSHSGRTHDRGNVANGHRHDGEIGISRESIVPGYWSRGRMDNIAVGIQSGTRGESHTHGLDIDSAGSHSHSLSVATNGNHQHTFNTQSAGGHQHSISVNQNGQHQHSLVITPTGENETRPRNIALLFCIKY